MLQALVGQVARLGQVSLGVIDAISNSTIYVICDRTGSIYSIDIALDTVWAIVTIGDCYLR